MEKIKLTALHIVEPIDKIGSYHNKKILMMMMVTTLMIIMLMKMD